ncbi:MAG: hypothetical protein ACOX8R_03110 [Bacillota bacterium]|jgi:hypothetical protein
MMKEVSSVMMSFVFGAAAGYVLRDRMAMARGKGDGMIPVVLVPRCAVKKAKKMKKVLRDAWEDLT